MKVRIFQILERAGKNGKVRIVLLTKDLHVEKRLKTSKLDKMEKLLKQLK